MKQRSNLLMRVLFCKIQCPSLFSLCKPSRTPHLYTHAPLKLENTQNTPNSNPVSVTFIADDDSSEKIIVEENCDRNEENVENDENTLRSCIRKKVRRESGGDSKEKKKVQWVDNFGKELIEVKEFESSETRDSDELDNRTCSCLILR